MGFRVQLAFTQLQALVFVLMKVVGHYAYFAIRLNELRSTTVDSVVFGQRRSIYAKLYVKTHSLSLLQ
jgi:hypothetical protein